MTIVIPPEFESYAREQVEAGFGGLRGGSRRPGPAPYAAYIAEIRALVDPAIAQADRGEGMDGDAFMEELIEETRAAHGG